MSKNIKFPISLKQILLFSSLIILVLGVSTFLVSTLIRANDRVNAEENNHTINGRTANTIEIIFDDIVNNSFVLFDGTSKVSNDNEKEALIKNYFTSNENVIFISSEDTNLKINPKFDNELTAKVKKYIDDKKVSKEINYYNSSDELNIPSIVVSYQYGPKNAVKNGFVGLKTEFLSDLMSTGANNTTILIDSKCNILINPDFSDKNKTFLDAKEYVDMLINSENQDNAMSLVKKADKNNYFISVHSINNNIFAVTTISESAVYEVIDRTTYRIILFSLAVLFIAIIIIRIFSNTITYPIADLVDASNKIEQGEFNLEIEPRTRDEIGLLTSSFIQMSHGLAEREKLMVSFSKFTNKVIAQKAANGELALGGETRNATIFFSDIRSFTAMSEKMRPDEVVDFLNQYMTLMVECVNKTNGVVDKYIGDAIMAVWGAPESNGSPAQDALNAVTTALMMRVSLFKFNKERHEKGLTPVKIGCGINSGPVVAGQIGSNERMEYTVIGDAVNLASRTEALNKPFATDILITENTYNLIKDKVIVEEMPGVHVKGKVDAIKMFAVINLAGRDKPSTIDEVRKIIGTTAPDLSKVNTDDEEKKYNIQTK